MTKKHPPPSSSSMKTSSSSNNNNNGDVVDISSVGVGVGVGKNKDNSKRSSSFSLAKYCDDRKSNVNNNNISINDDDANVDAKDDDDANANANDISRRVYHGICPDVSNRYRKVGDGHRIGQGTYGVVYRARDTWVINNNVNGNGNNNANGNRNGNGKTHSSASQNKKTKNPQQTNKNNNNNNNNSNNNIVALKKCYAHHESSDGFSITTLREINALRVCSTHPNIVNLLEIAVSSSGGNSNENKDDDDDNGKDNDNKEDSNKKRKRTRTTKMKIGNVFLVFEHCQYDLAQILDSYYNYNQKQKHSNSNNRNRSSDYNSNSSKSSKSRSNSSPFTTKQVQLLSKQLVSAIEFCHRHNIIHRDIKPSNLLYDVSKNGGQLKLCDFGLSRICCVPQSFQSFQSFQLLSQSVTSTIPLPTPSAPMTPNVVSLWYRAPELLLPTNIITTSSSSSTTNNSNSNSKNSNSNSNNSNNKNKNNNNSHYSSSIQYSFPIDLWSIGCVIAELLQGSPFLDGKSEIDQLQKMIQTIGRIPTHLYQYNDYNNNNEHNNEYNNDNNNKQYSQPQHPQQQSLWDKFDYLSVDGLTLLTRLLEYDPKERWDAKHALQSNYFDENANNDNNNDNNDNDMPTQFYVME